MDPDTSLIRNGAADSSPLTSDGFNTGDDDFSLAGNPLQGDLGNDLLAPRSDSLDAFSDPLNTIRPFEPVFFGFDQYNINATERDKLVEIASFLQTNPNCLLKVIVTGKAHLLTTNL